MNEILKTYAGDFGKVQKYFSFLEAEGLTIIETLNLFEFLSTLFENEQSKNIK